MKKIKAPSILEEIIMPESESKAKKLLMSLVGEDVIVIRRSGMWFGDVEDYDENNGINISEEDYVGFDKRSPTRLRHTVYTEDDNTMGGPGFYTPMKGIVPVRLYKLK